MDKTNKEVDIYRDTPLRYLGYANEVGEAFRSVVPKSVVWFSYFVASGYVLADTIDKGLKTYHARVTSKTTKQTLFCIADTILWHSFASIIIPGFTINRICAAVQYAQRKSKSCALKNRWMPIVAGLVFIPVIIHPIDNLVENTMEVTYRKWTGYSK